MPEDSVLWHPPFIGVFKECGVLHIRKRLAVFANGWAIDYVQQFLTGVSEVATATDTDLFVFMDFSAKDEYTKINIGESNIFRLPNLKDFEFAILMTNSFNLQEETDYVYRSVMESGIPAVSLEYMLNGIPSILTDNYSGMQELAKHLILEQGARQLVYVSGPEDHVENATRLQAVRDVAHENGLRIQNEDIIFGRWSQDPAKAQVIKWIDEHGALPDAFVCANDLMALGVYDALAELGYHVPEDVLVTGFDNIKISRDMQPPLATVSRDWHAMGMKAMQLLLDKRNGSDIPAATVIPTNFIRRSSCGCTMPEETRPSCRTGDALRYDCHFRGIHWAVRDSDTAEILYENFKRLFQRDNWMEGNNFLLCLEKEFFRICERDINLKTTGYSEDIDVICALNNGIARPHQTIGCRDVIFRAAGTRPDPAMYIFVPLHNDERSYGFAMFSRNIDVLEDHYLYIWTRQVNMCLEQVRRNITIRELTQKLTNLSVTDVLTGVYNRTGCEQIAYPMLEEAHRLGKTSVIMLADIDRMKVINDQYGHVNGDLALRTAVSVLRSQLPSDWIICRIGGDEFFIGGVWTEDIDPEKLIENITGKLAHESKRLQLPFHLGLSLGYVKVNPEDNMDLESRLRTADRHMYENKSQHHNNIRREGVD